PTRNPFFQTMFVLQSASGPQPQAAGLKFEPVEFDNGTSKFDFSLSLAESPTGGLHVAVEYRTDLFEAATMERLLGHYQVLLAAAVRSPGDSIARLPLMSAAERHQVLSGWNATGTEFPRDHCIHELVEAQVHRTPTALAVAGRHQQWTYAELNERANRFAHQLARLGVEPEMPVAVLVHRSPDMIAVLLGVLKAGGAYLPFDPVHPPERIAATLRDARVRVLVTEKALWDRLAQHARGITPLFLDADTDEAVREPTGNPGRTAAAENLAYVIYTSGSTGTPKGVAVTHRNVANLITWYQRAWKILPSDRTTQLMSPAFDPSVLEIWSSLTIGASLHLPPDDVRVSPPDLVRWYEEHRITVSILPTPLGEALLDESWPRSTTMRLLLTGGDRLQRRPPEHLPCPLINLYGPTESTVVTTWSTVAGEGQAVGAPDIGHPMANTEVYVLDAQLQPVPAGIPGELFIGGTGLARGYLHQPGLTAERFVPNPLADAPSARLYRTGDRVRFRGDGALEYLGRLDEQVKIRGFRIEPGEIEAALSAQPGVRECVVVAREDVPGDKRLAAYVVVPAGAKPELQVWRDALGRRLPDYMVPSAFVLLDKLPLTSNGKINRAALPAPDRDAGSARRAAVAPRDAVETQLARIWEQILGLEGVGVNESFFQLGGHSMAGVRLFSRIEKEFGRRLPLASLFEHPTIEELAHRLRSPETATTVSSLVALQPRGTRPPVFFVHGAGGGNLWTYTNLVPHLGADQPVYALESRGMRGLAEFTTIEEMATHYIREIRTVQPQGPYYLAGYCFGGNVAFEMALQLEAAGERVAFVGLLDSAASNSSYQKIPWWRPEFHYRFAANTAFWLTDFLAQSGRDQWRFVRRKARAIFRRLVRGEGAPEVDEVIDVSLFPEIELDLWKTHLRALARYEARSAYRGKLSLFRTRGHPFLCSFDPVFGWGPLSGAVDMVGVPGAHERVFMEPHVRDLSARFRARLETAQHQTLSPAHP
ncbi:MAG: amino acid adenylation protein, partial [Lacunisphaera sp.]|nr:amino acid adenylation protein [Lacunisphaera sp.]